MSKGEKRTLRLFEDLGATPTGHGGYHHTPESFAAAIGILVVTILLAIFFPRGC
jgi:hypothetical protein